jgi:hypothetical protein
MSVPLNLAAPPSPPTEPAVHADADADADADAIKEAYRTLFDHDGSVADVTARDLAVVMRELGLPVPQPIPASRSSWNRSPKWGEGSTTHSSQP